ncbi:hypothetical protein [Bartonella doshiae]|uniref:hypothetical protein n=1 Tax=Bartonella doshiae TaxID=33044 RepID=UPI0002ECF14B|nr:hypothetical protein [Bartonella doshiae]MBB6158854.1 hypothetical protein [Bartonella doshiae]
MIVIVAYTILETTDKYIHIICLFEQAYYYFITHCENSTVLCVGLGEFIGFRAFTFKRKIA